MRLTRIIWSSWIATSIVLSFNAQADNRLEYRDGNTASAFPTLGSASSQSASAAIRSKSDESITQSTQSATNTGSPAASATSSDSVSVSVAQTTNNTSIVPTTSSSASVVSTPAPTTSGTINTNSTALSNEQVTLPLQPHITPALSIGGVVLILSGVVYALIGVKNRWVHIFLSTAYLTSLSITVLIVYVLNPPVSNAIQGAYFVGIFMTGVIFGGGALIFKEVTEGLGCLLGGFCLSMWFLTLKDGGLITSTGGKAIFISAFCVVAWSLSFSHYTRSYGLMGSIAFSGATAFVLGVDCFSRGGLKEFWLYIWGLNDNIFPLNTNTYPITRGTRVETIVIVLACGIGIISQIRLWKVVKDRQSKRNAEQQEEGRRREAVEAALGRHLERQNDRDRSQWEKQYGNQLSAKRETILWTDAHGEKGFSRLKETELAISQSSSSSDTLEMANIPRKSRSMYVTRIRRQSRPVTSIAEVEEGESTNQTQTRQEVLEQLEGRSSRQEAQPVSSPGLSPVPSPNLENNDASVSGRASADGVPDEQIPASKNRKSQSLEAQGKAGEKRNSDFQKYLTAPEDEKKKKRRSFTSFLSRSTKGDDDAISTTQSQEALVIPETSLHHSRASSLAATLDFENENLEFPVMDIDMVDHSVTPEIVVSSVDVSHSSKAQPRLDIKAVPTFEPELEEEDLEQDPEEFVRPTVAGSQARSPDQMVSSGANSMLKRQSGSEIATDVLFNDTAQAKAVPTEPSPNETLTKSALELMPSQLSHVVMSYRTNEWAKHISTAEVPVFEEPEPIEATSSPEAPTHLADLTSAVGSKRSSLNQTLPPEVAAPVPSALPSPTEGIRINPAIRPEQPTVSAVIETEPPMRVKSKSESTKAPRGFRSTSSPMLVKLPPQSAAADEHSYLEFIQRQNNTRSTSMQSFHHTNGSASPALIRPSTGMSMQRPVSRLSLVSEHGVGPARSNSQMSHYPQGPYMQGQFHTLPSRSETRLQNYESHQPTRRNDELENQRREAMLADWRGSRQRIPDQQQSAEAHRQQMLMQRQQIKMMEEQEKNYKMQQEFAIDARMRGRDMQELHREAMRRMQAGVNKSMNT